MHRLDPHERPPMSIRNVYKKYQKMKLKELDQDQEIVDLSSDASAASSSRVRVVREYAAENLTAAFRAFAGDDADLRGLDMSAAIPVYEHEDMPGKVFLVVFPTSILVPVAVLKVAVSTFEAVFTPDGR
jgi:alkylated DNA repair protein alkB family protein 1